MTVLYNCKTDGDQFRISKFDDLGNVESTYLCSETECQCPAGHRASCRHRIMLPLFIASDKVDSFYFLDFDRKGWVSNEPAPLEIVSMVILPDDVSAEELVEAYSNLLGKQVSTVHEGVPIVEVEYLPSTKPSWRRI